MEDSFTSVPSPNVVGIPTRQSPIALDVNTLDNPQCPPAAMENEELTISQQMLERSSPKATRPTSARGVHVILEDPEDLQENHDESNLEVFPSSPCSPMRRKDSTASRWALLAASTEAEAKATRERSKKPSVYDNYIQSRSSRAESAEVESRLSRAMSIRQSALAHSEKAPDTFQSTSSLQSNAIGPEERVSAIFASAAAAAEEAARVRRQSSESAQAKDVKVRIGGVAAIPVGEHVRLFDNKINKWVNAVVVGPYDIASRAYKLDANSFASVNCVRRDRMQVPKPEDEANLEAIFQRCSVDSYGRISLHDLTALAMDDASVAQALGVDTADKAKWKRSVQSLVEGIEDVQKQMLNWNEFFFWQRRLAQPQVELESIFHACDRDRTGRMSAGELSVLVHKDCTVAEFFNVCIDDELLYKADLRRFVKNLQSEKTDQKMTLAQFRLWNARLEASIR